MIATTIRREGSVTEALEQVLEVTRRHAAECDVEAAFPAAALQALRDTGLLGLLVGREHGGPGGEIDQVIDVTMRIAREDMSVGLIFAMHCQQVAALLAYASDKLRAELLPRIARGEVYLASVTTERSGGGHLLSSTSGLGKGDAGLLIDRDAPIVTGGVHADGFLITMRAPGAASSSDVSLVYAERDQLEVSLAGDWQPLGMRASHSLPMRLTGVVPEHQLIGAHGAFREIVTSVFAPLAHLGWSAAWLGAASGALSRTVRQIRSPQGRKQFDLRSELLLTRLARVRGRLDMVHAMLKHTLAVYRDQDRDLTSPPVQLLLNALKTNAAEECFAAAHELVEIAGLRHGYMRGSALALERTFRDLRSASLNYSNDRLHLVDGRLALVDAEVSLA